MLPPQQPPPTAPRGCGYAVRGHAPARDIGLAEPDDPPCVLVVEDDVALRSLLRAVLEDAGWRVQTVGRAPTPEAVAALNPDVLLLDLILDGRDDGWRLLEALKAPPASPVPIVVCTASVALLRREAARLPALTAAVVVKPFDLDDLLAGVARGLRQRRGGQGQGARERFGAGTGAAAAGAAAPATTAAATVAAAAFG